MFDWKRQPRLDGKRSTCMPAFRHANMQTDPHDTHHAFQFGRKSRSQIDFTRQSESVKEMDAAWCLLPAAYCLLALAKFRLDSCWINKLSLLHTLRVSLSKPFRKTTDPSSHLMQSNQIQIIFFSPCRAHLKQTFHQQIDFFLANRLNQSIQETDF